MADPAHQRTDSAGVHEPGDEQFLNEARSLERELSAAMNPAGRWVRRVAVLGEATSTQDAALEVAGRDGPGTVVFALRQSGGRGRQGRQWADPGGMGIAATLVADWPAHSLGALSLRAGLAACLAAEACLGFKSSLPQASHAIGLRWPNDVVESTAHGPGRKLAGVLIERRGGHCLVGIGINVLQANTDWPADLRSAAVSLRQLSYDRGLGPAGSNLLEALEATLSMDDPALLEAWKHRDLLLGRVCEFVHDGARVRGRVVALRPLDAIEIVTEDGVAVTLAAPTTSLVRHEP
jgi:BirA family biotin operon repressor/biotin-[acetyl-CoA-carboxylase] ligase